MLKKIKLIGAILVGLIGTERALSKTVDSIYLSPERTVYVQGEVNDNLSSQTRKLLELSALPAQSSAKVELNKSPAPIWIVINTFGGDLYASLDFISAIKAAKDKGITVKCLVTNTAMSAGYFIYTQCSERYALPHSTMMFHFVRTSAPSMISILDLMQLLQIHNSINKMLIGLVKGINLKEDMIIQAFMTEFEWSAKDYVNTYDKELGYIILANKVEGIPAAALELGAPRRFDPNAPEAKANSDKLLAQIKVTYGKLVDHIKETLGQFIK